jgi:hypothetical protein
MTNELTSDLARLREIAEEGRRMPLLGGRHQIIWGVAIMVASLLHWAVVTRILAWPIMSLAYIWFGLTLTAAMIARTVLPQKLHSAPHGIANRIERAVWQFGGSALGLFSIAIFATALWHQHHSSSTEIFRLFTLMPPIAFAVYALALRTSAEAADLPLLKPFAIMALACVPITVALAGSPWQLLVQAVGIAFVAVIPGLKLVALEKGTPNG